MTSQLSSAYRIVPASILPCAVPLASASEATVAEASAPAACSRRHLLENVAVLASTAVVGLCLVAVITVSICWHGLYLDARAGALDSTLDRGFEPAVLEVVATPGQAGRAGMAPVRG